MHQGVAVSWGYGGRLLITSVLVAFLGGRSAEPVLGNSETTKMERGEREGIITVAETKKDGIGNCAGSWLPWVVRLAGARVAEERNSWAGLNRQEDEV